LKVISKLYFNPLRFNHSKMEGVRTFKVDTKLVPFILGPQNFLF
jgi:hypothetical protein